MKLQQRKAVLVRLGQYMNGDSEEWELAKHRAFLNNNWFIPEFIDLSVQNIASGFLNETALEHLAKDYSIPEENPAPRKIGLVMAGNIPLVGFHDLICVFLSGNYAWIKPSSKDEVLIKHLVAKMIEWAPDTSTYLVISGLLKNCDAYIATGSNNASRYFEYYFRNYPSIIRRNRTSVAILEGKESTEELEALAVDVYQYFGLGCRNVTKIFVPRGYDFIPLLEAFKSYDRLINHHKFKNNYDYNLTVHILNNRYYMTNGSLVLVEDPSPFSPIGQLHFEYYGDADEVRQKLLQDENIQCVVGKKDIPFGQAQCPTIKDYADGVDTLKFLLGLQPRPADC
ncbi:MAG: acyl-CoA reductase [Flavisolibacter sp.]